MTRTEIDISDPFIRSIGPGYEFAIARPFVGTKCAYHDDWRLYCTFFPIGAGLTMINDVDHWLIERNCERLIAHKTCSKRPIPVFRSYRLANLDIAFEFRLTWM